MQSAIFTTLFAQLWLALLASAAPLAEDVVTATGHGNAWQYGTGGGILGLIVLILDIIVLIEVFKSNRTPAGKLIWGLVVFLFPVIGLIIYWLFSDRAGHNAGYEPVA
ncbi:hypothetical protein MAPG_05336 [Magnaporthiopsis poae ATCC 64411]|uniref:Cardiolipin synthase N-terminal domain-containing protein n=1 Tax=Magnaporthiopsis poae (strain ATCC 64411 / 73-15) TaxID=644358 RepID=A0A0C4DZ47_MAGP6|nr:hypothetical protein MAPG_05336 [Magnaporthiopsis poae ATCC 64411]